MSERTTAPNMSEEEYKRALATERFIQELICREEDNERFPCRSGLVIDDEVGIQIKRQKSRAAFFTGNVTYINDINEMEDVIDDSNSFTATVYADGWPNERAYIIANALTEHVPEIGVDTFALSKYWKMRDFADKLNEAYDTVISGGNAEKEQIRQKRKARKLSGDNYIGPSRYPSSHQLGFMACGAGRKFDIKGGVAMRATTSIRPDIHGNIAWGSSSGDTLYAPFPDKDQETAIRLIRSLSEKQLDRAFELQRAGEVKEAKVMLGTAGLIIPRPHGQS